MDKNSELVDDLVKGISSQQNAVKKVREEVQHLLDEQKKMLTDIIGERESIEEVAELYSLPHLIENINLYSQKAAKLEQDMKHISIRSDDLKVQATSLLDEKEEQDKLKLEEVSLQEQRERQLLAKPTWDQCDKKRKSPDE